MESGPSADQRVDVTLGRLRRVRPAGPTAQAPCVDRELGAIALRLQPGDRPVRPRPWPPSVLTKAAFGSRPSAVSRGSATLRSCSADGGFGAAPVQRAPVRPALGGTAPGLGAARPRVDRDGARDAGRAVGGVHVDLVRRARVAGALEGPLAVAAHAQLDASAGQHPAMGVPTRSGTYAQGRSDPAYVGRCGASHPVRRRARGPGGEHAIDTVPTDPGRDGPSGCRCRQGSRHPSRCEAPAGRKPRGAGATVRAAPGDEDDGGQGDQATSSIPRITYLQATNSSSQNLTDGVVLGRPLGFSGSARRALVGRRSRPARPRPAGPRVVVDLERLLLRAALRGHVLQVDPDPVPERAAAPHPVDEDVGGLQVRRDVRMLAASSAPAPPAPPASSSRARSPSAASSIVPPAGALGRLLGRAQLLGELEQPVERAGARRRCPPTGRRARRTARAPSGSVNASGSAARHLAPRSAASTRARRASGARSRPTPPCGPWRSG